VALTDAQGHLLGECLNPQPVWRMVKQSPRESESDCPFCLAPPAPCSAVVDALRTGAVVMTQDGAGLAHVAVPLSLGGRHGGRSLQGRFSPGTPNHCLCSEWPDTTESPRSNSGTRRLSRFPLQRRP
jgi:hypothetical protein